MARKKGERGSRKSLKQQYDFLKAKGAEVVTDLNHDPAKNANSVVLKTGAGNTAENAEGKVHAGYLYYLCKGTWTKTDFTSDPQPNQPAACAGRGTAAALVGIAMGEYGKYSGTPEEVGMLISGVTTTTALTAAPIAIGDRLWATCDNGLGAANSVDISGTLTTGVRNVATAKPVYGNVVRPMGFVIDYDPDYKTLGVGLLQYTVVALFQPSPVATWYGYATGSAIYQEIYP